MRIIKYTFAIAIIAAAIFAVTGRKAEATSGSCKIEAVTPVTVQDHGKNFTINEAAGTVTAKFKVTGNSNCKKSAVLATWIMPNATGQPLESQKFYDWGNKSKHIYSPGVHTITAKYPKCDFWQFDLLEGADPKGINGTANYGNLMHPVSNTSKAGYRRNMLDTKLGGNKCEDPKPKDVCPNIKGMQEQVPEGYVRDEKGNCVIIPQDEDVCPNIEEMQKEVPAGYTIDENGNCVMTPEDPQDPVQPEVQGKGTPTVLPSTGAGAIATTFLGVSTSAGLAHAIIRRMRNRFLG